MWWQPKWIQKLIVYQNYLLAGGKPIRGALPSQNADIKEIEDWKWPTSSSIKQMAGDAEE